MGAWIAVIEELVAARLPGLPAVARPLDLLAEPAGRLGRVEAVRVGSRSLEMVDLPAAEVRAAHLPPFPGAVGGQDERALPCTH